MKQYLLGATALVAAVGLMAGGALAADKKMMSKPSIAVGGYWESVVGGIVDEDYTGHDVTDTSALDTRTDSEIHFNGRGTTDNGLKLHARVELEGQNNHSQCVPAGDPPKCTSDPIDEYFLSVSGSFGRIILGGTGGAPLKMLTGFSGSFATNVGESLSYDMSWIKAAGKGARHMRLGDNDAEKLTYISPKFGGFQVGVSYLPNTKNNDDNSRVDADGGYHDGLEGAFSYSGRFGDVGFGVGAGMTAYQAGDETNAKDQSEWLAAARLDFGGGFRVAASHRSNTDDDKASRFEVTDLGARFVQGTNSFSLTGSYTEHEGGDEATRLMGSYARAMGPGVKAHLNVLHDRSENAAGTVESVGTTLVSGIRVSF